MKNKRVEIRIDSETLELLDSLCLRYHYNKSEIIRLALMQFAARRKHYITIGYFSPDDKKPNKENQADIEEAIKIANIDIWKK